MKKLSIATSRQLSSWIHVITLAILIVPVILEALIKTFPDTTPISIWGAAIVAALGIVLRFLTDMEGGDGS